MIAATAFASVLALHCTREQFPLGVSFGPPVAAGRWWLLLTSTFVHAGLYHFVWNMLPFAFFGTKLERLLGHWSLLLFYLACGAAGALTSLSQNPESITLGASGAVFGVCGGLIAHYALRSRALTRPQWLKLAALVAFTAFSFWPGRFDPNIDHADHLGGLATGIILGLILSAPFAWSATVRRSVFACALLLLSVAAFSFRETHPYLVHLDAASRALQNGQPDAAARELHIALAMKPDSPIGHFLLNKLQPDQLTTDH